MPPSSRGLGQLSFTEQAGIRIPLGVANISGIKNDENAKKISDTRCTKIRDVAQLGRVPALGADGRRFKSCYPDSFTTSLISSNSLAHETNFKLRRLKKFV